MKRIVALLLACSLALSGCVSQNTGVKETSAAKKISSETTALSSEDQVAVQSTDVSFTDLSDPNLLAYVEDTVYLDLVYKLDSESYFVENVSAIYISKEFLEELAYNSKENIYFGFTLSELEEQFVGTKYIFTLGDDGQTTVQEFEEYDDTYDKVIKNVAIGVGVILVCVTVSVVSAAIGAPAVVTMIFYAAAENGTIVALSSGVFSGCAAGIVTGIETKDFDQAIKSAALAGSNGFKWGAITGAIIGGATAANALKGAKPVPNPNGKMGGAAHQAEIAKQVAKYDKPGFSVNSEARIYTPGGMKPYRYADFAVTNNATSETWYGNVGRQLQSGLPVARERYAISDVKGAGGDIQFFPYN